ncbi:MAG: hypothetical protein IJ405_06560 [Lachnospiraceae bacterium]|nr:hypothetical protein [Lachnospiraceae bacterium]
MNDWWGVNGHGYVNTDSQYYNREFSEEDFEAMLDTGIYWENAYIVFEQE